MICVLNHMQPDWLVKPNENHQAILDWKLTSASAVKCTVLTRTFEALSQQ